MLKKYLIQNGKILSVIDGSEVRADILVDHGIVKKISARIVPDAETEVIDAAGLTITTGWVDAHCHIGTVENTVGRGIGMNPYDAVLTQGVTFVIDPGTAGPENYQKYREDLLYRTDLRYVSYLNMGKWGINIGRKDTESIDDVDEASVERVFEKYRGEFLGLKIRIDSNFCFDSTYMLEHTRRLADKLGTGMLVHAPRCDKSIDYVLSYLKKGDVLTHVFAGHTPLMKAVDSDGKLKPCIAEACSRGVLFDLGHGTNSFCYEVAEDCWKGGFFPHTVSTDLWLNNYHGPCYNMAVVLTKLRGITKMPWVELLRKITIAPVMLNHLQGKALEIQEGQLADMTAFSIDPGKYRYGDSAAATRVFEERMHVHFTCLGEKVYRNTRTDDICAVE